MFEYRAENKVYIRVGIIDAVRREVREGIVTLDDIRQVVADTWTDKDGETIDCCIVRTADGENINLAISIDALWEMLGDVGGKRL